jgi:hypothetical protein
VEHEDGGAMQKKDAWERGAFLHLQSLSRGREIWASIPFHLPSVVEAAGGGRSMGDGESRLPLGPSPPAMASPSPSRIKKGRREGDGRNTHCPLHVLVAARVRSDELRKERRG